jgi:hypothetical protein
MPCSEPHRIRATLELPLAYHPPTLLTVGLRDPLAAGRGRVVH